MALTSNVSYSCPKTFFNNYECKILSIFASYKTKTDNNSTTIEAK